MKTCTSSCYTVLLSGQLIIDIGGGPQCLSVESFIFG
jgi:hypothetical protein